MNILFWNTHKNEKINEILLLAIKKYCIDIVILAEYVDNIDSLINDLYIENMHYKEIKPIACKKIQVICKKNIFTELHNDNTHYISIFIKKHDLEFELFATHLPSKLYTQEGDIKLAASTLKSDVEKYDKALVVGDFNCNPFESAISALTGMLALPTKEYSKRTVQGIEKNILYNPMWKFFGDFETIPGTYFYNNGSDLNYYWNIFDQVLVSQNLVEEFVDEKLEILKEIDGKNLIKNNKVNKEFSDHLPIIFSLKEEKNG